jgi:hypothetical protein
VTIWTRTKSKNNGTQQTVLCNWGLTEDQSAVMLVQPVYPADGMLLISSFYLQFLVSNLASVPGGQLVNSPTAQSLGRCALV